MSLKPFAIFTRDLLAVAESTVKLGRRNLVVDDFTSLQVVIDRTGQAAPLARSESFDGDTEIMSRTIQYQTPYTINFYGVGGMAEAYKFANLTGGQAGIELQEALGISVFGISGITDVKMLTGEQYKERAEISLNVINTIKTDVATLRIDEAQNTFISD